MKPLLIIRKDFISRRLRIRRPKATNLMLLEKRTIVRWSMYVGILIAYYGTLLPWPLWPINRFVPILAALPIVVSLLLSRNLKQPIFDRKDYLLPLLSCFILLLSLAMTSGKNFNAILMALFSATIFLSLFKINPKELNRIGDMLAKSMALLMCLSIPFYIMYLMGVSLPHSHIVPSDWDYSYENYRFFLIDDRAALELIPRFHSVFLEPSHLGMACIALLYAQIGKWNTWRCRVLFLTIVMTFSLAAYLCLVVMLFSAAWMKGKAILGKVVLLLGIVIGIVVASFVYRNGDNLFNRLIVQRMTIDNDGKLEGDNRTDETFTREFDKLMSSNQALFGKGLEGMERFGSHGNSGYRVFIYMYGLVSVFLLVVFFFSFLRTSNNTRAKVAMSIISLLSFVAHGIPTKFYFFIPLYILVFIEVYPTKQLKGRKTRRRIVWKQEKG